MMVFLVLYILILKKVLILALYLTLHLFLMRAWTNIIKGIIKAGNTDNFNMQNYTGFLQKMKKAESKIL